MSFYTVEMLDKNQIRVIFLFEFKMGCKAVEITCNINNAFGPGTTNARSCAKETKRALKMRRTVADRGRPSEVDNDQLRPIVKADPLTTTWEVGEELNIDHSEVIQHWKQIGKVKKLDKWVPHELTANSKKLFWSFVFSYSIEQQWTISQLDCGMQWKTGFYTVTCDDQLRLDQEEAPKHFLKPNLHQKKGSWVTVWWFAAGLSHYSFLNPGKIIIPEKYVQQIDEMQWKLQCLQWSTEWTQFFSPTMPNCTSQSMLQKLNEWGYKVLPYLPYSPDLSPTNYYFFKHPDNFLQGKCFHNQQEAQNTFQEFVKSWSMDFYATGINQTYFSLAKMCWL